MKIFAIFILLFSDTPRLCMFCKHCIPTTNKAMCSLFPKIENEKEGEPNDYFYCSTARNINHMCGKEVKRFES